MQIIFYLIIYIAAYLLGSASSAIIVCRLLHLPDPRTQGSKNPGATNVLRYAGKKIAALVLIGDMLKGTIAVLLAKLIGVQGTALALVALIAFIGHIYPIFFKFQGGKGVATAFGGIVGLSLWLGGAALICWILIARFSRYSSLAALMTSAIIPPLCLFIADTRYFAPLLIMSAIIIYRHADNIGRLLSNTEHKIGEKKKDDKQK